MRGPGAQLLRGAPRPEKRASFWQGRTRQVRQGFGLLQAGRLRGQSGCMQHQWPWIRPKQHARTPRGRRRAMAAHFTLGRSEARAPSRGCCRQYARPARPAVPPLAGHSQPAANRCRERTHLSTFPAALRTSAPGAAHVAGVGRATFSRSRLTVGAAGHREPTTVNRDSFFLRWRRNLVPYCFHAGLPSARRALRRFFRCQTFFSVFNHDPQQSLHLHRLTLLASSSVRFYPG